MSKLQYTHKLLGGILLVAGTCIGVGMLAMPVSTGFAGFYPSLALLFFSWLFMTISAFLILEVSLWMKEGTNLISMAERTLGNIGKNISGISYLMLLYALVAAYIGMSSQLVEEAAEVLFNIDLPQWFYPIPVLILFGSFVYLGTGPVDYLNRFLMVGVVITYLLLIAFLPSHVDTSLFEHSDWPYLMVSASVVMTTFGYAVIIPSLSTYLKHDTGQLKSALLIGSTIPLFVFVAWEFVTLGIVPLEGEHGLIASSAKDLAITASLKSILVLPWITAAARFFAFFSITTSFLGVALSLSDFLADGLKIKKTESGRIIVCLLTFLPPLAFNLSGIRAFYIALEYAGIFVAILLGILPVLMAWRGRYTHGLKGSFQMIGGKPLLVVTLLFFTTIALIEAANKMGFLHFIKYSYHS